MPNVVPDRRTFSPRLLIARRPIVGTNLIAADFRSTPTTPSDFGHGRVSLLQPNRGLVRKIYTLVRIITYTVYPFNLSAFHRSADLFTAFGRPRIILISVVKLRRTYSGKCNAEPISMSSPRPITRRVIE